MRRLCSPCESVPLSRSCPSTRLYGGKISTKFAPPDRSTLKTLGIQSLVRILYWPQPLISGVTQKNICWQASILGLYHSSFNPFIYHSQPNFRFRTQDYTACCQPDYCRKKLSLCQQISHNWAFAQVELALPARRVESQFLKCRPFVEVIWRHCCTETRCRILITPCHYRLD